MWAAARCQKFMLEILRVGYLQMMELFGTLHPKKSLGLWRGGKIPLHRTERSGEKIMLHDNTHEDFGSEMSKSLTAADKTQRKIAFSVWIWSELFKGCAWNGGATEN